VWRLVLLAFLVAVAIPLIFSFPWGCLFGRDGISLKDLADPSLDFDKPHHPTKDTLIENGRAFDQATVTIAPGNELILPPWTEQDSLVRMTIRTDGAAGVVTLLLQKSLFDMSWGHTFRLRDFRKSKSVWKRQVGSALVIDFDGGHSHRHGGSKVAVVVIVGKGTPFRQEELTSPFFEGHRDHTEPKAPGWEEVPQQPLPKSQWPWTPSR
jgi:hypothetical protein